MHPRVIRILLIVSAASALGILLGSFQLLQITSNSMAETLVPGDYVVISRMGGFLINRMGYSVQYGRGDMVASRAPDRIGIVVKRIAGVAGDRLRIQAGQLILNGAAVAEPYVGKASLRDSWPEDRGAAGPRDVIVPAGSYFVLGDNRAASLDSRTFGSVPKSRIIGRVVMVWHSR